MVRRIQPVFCVKSLPVPYFKNSEGTSTALQWGRDHKARVLIDFAKECSLTVTSAWIFLIVCGLWSSRCYPRRVGHEVTREYEKPKRLNKHIF